MSKFYNIDTNTSLGGENTSDIVVSSQKAIKTYVDNGLDIAEDHRLFIYRSLTGTAAKTSSPYYCARWDVTDENVTEYFDGMVVCLKIPVAGHGTYGTALQINELGYKPVVYNVNSMISTRYSVGSVLWCVYNATQTANLYINSTSASTITGCWQVMDYDKDTTAPSNITRYNGTRVVSNDLLRYVIAFRKNETTIVPIHSVAGTGTSANTAVTATTKAMTTESFDPFGEIYYYATNTKVVSGDNVSLSSLSTQKTGCDARYIFNCAKTLTANRELYLVVDLQSDGMVKLATTVNPWSQTLPNTNDGHLYILLGYAYSTYQYELYYYHPIYYHDGTRLRIYGGDKTFSGDYNDLSNKPTIRDNTNSGQYDVGYSIETGTVNLNDNKYLCDKYGVFELNTQDVTNGPVGATFGTSVSNYKSKLISYVILYHADVYRQEITNGAFISYYRYYRKGYGPVTPQSITGAPNVGNADANGWIKVVEAYPDYAGNAGYALTVNSDEDDVEWTNVTPQQSDWDQEDSDSPDYVKNRTHYRHYGYVEKDIISSCQVAGHHDVVWVYCEGSALDFFFDDQKADGTYKKFGWIVNGTEFGMFSPVNQHEYNFSSGDPTICDVYIGNEPTSSLTSGMYYIQRSYDSENDIMRLTGYFLGSTERAAVDWSSWLTSSIVVWEDWIYETLDNRYLDVALNDLSDVEIGDPIDYENTYFPDALVNEGRHYDAIVLNNKVWLTSNFIPNYFQDGTPIPIRNVASAADPYGWNQMYNISAVLSKNFFPNGWGIYDEYSKLNSSTPKAYASTTGWYTSSVTGSPGCDPDENNSSGLGLTPETSSGMDGRYLNIPSGSSNIYAYALSYDQRTISYTQKTIGTDTAFYSVRLTYNGSVRDFINHYYKERLRDGDILRYDATKQKWVNSSDYNNIQEVTYDELVSLRDNAQLVKGKQYKIIDYETLINGDLVNIGTVSHNTSINSDDYEYARAINSYPFDIIVTATSESTLDEHARASAKPGDTYADYINDLELKYCLDNNRYYAWSLDYYDANITYEDVEDPDNPITKTTDIRFYKTNRTHTSGNNVYPMYIGIIEGTLQTFYQSKSTIEDGDVLEIQMGD